MKHFTSHCPVRAVIFLACPFMALPLAQAQTQPVELQPAGSEAAIQAQWNKLQQANSRITAAHVVWRRVQRINPIPDADPEKWAAAALAAARENGMTEEQAQQQAQSERREAVRSKQERVINSTLDFTRIGTSVLCNIEHPDPDYRSRAIEFSDGTDALFAWTQVKGREEDRKDGNLTRDLSDVLKFSAGGNHVARILLGIPLNQNFAPTNPALSSTNASLKLLPNGDVTVEREARIEGNRSQDPDTVVFAKRGLYPLLADTFDILTTIDGDKFTMQKDKLRTRSVAIGHKQYAGGIWFPSKVTQTTPVSTTEFSLVEAKFNDQVDPADVRLPPDLNIADVRFGDGSKLVNYQVKDGKLPSDEQVKALLQMDKQATQAKKVSKETTTNTKLSASPFGSGAGLGFIALGGLMLLKGRRKDS